MLTLFYSICLIVPALGRIDVVQNSWGKHVEDPIRAGKQSDWWQYSEDSGEPCRPGPAVFSLHNDIDSFTIKADGDDENTLVHVRAYASGILVQGLQTPINEFTTQFNVTYTCQPDTVWSNAFLELEFVGKTYYISYVRICDADRIQKWDWGQVLLLFVTVVVVASAAQQVAKFSVLEDEEQPPELQTHHAIAFVVVGSIALLVIFFMIYYANIGLTVLISISACSAITLMVGELLSYAPCMTREISFGRFGTVGQNYIIGFIVAVGVIGMYLYTKHWMLNNIIAIFMVFMFLKALRLSTLKVAALLLGLAFFYDIFWVFISSYIFGDNVMVAVAQGLDLPMKLQCPHIDSNDPISNACSMIGLGDLILPGVVIAFAFRVDLSRQSRYYLWLLLAYIAALCLCEAVLVLTLHAQPALLYISPLIIGTFTATAWARGEFKQVWSGEILNPSTEDSFSNYTLLEMREEANQTA